VELFHIIVRPSQFRSQLLVRTWSPGPPRRDGRGACLLCSRSRQILELLDVEILDTSEKDFLMHLRSQRGQVGGVFLFPIDVDRFNVDLTVATFHAGGLCAYHNKVVIDQARLYNACIHLVSFHVLEELLGATSIWFVGPAGDILD